MGNAETELCVVHTASNSAEAGFLAGELERNGIACDIKGGDIASPNPACGLYVMRKDLERAKEILAVGIEPEEKKEQQVTPKTFPAEGTNRMMPRANFIGGVVVGGALVWGMYAFGIVEPNQESTGEYHGTYEYDTNKDGKDDKWLDYEHDELRQRRSDTNGDGEVDYWEHYSDGVLSRTEADRSGDKKPDEWNEYKEGKLHKRVTDLNFDGKADSWTYLEQGKTVRSENDYNFDGKVDEWITLDEFGFAKSVEKDWNYDGKPDGWQHYANARPQSAEGDVNFDGEPDTWSIYEHGEFVERRWALNLDGKVNKKAFYKYGIKTKEVFDLDGDGSFETERILDELEQVLPDEE